MSGKEFPQQENKIIHHDLLNEAAVEAENLSSATTEAVLCQLTASMSLNNQINMERMSFVYQNSLACAKIDELKKNNFQESPQVCPELDH